MLSGLQKPAIYILMLKTEKSMNAKICLHFECSECDHGKGKEEKQNEVADSV